MYSTQGSKASRRWQVCKRAKEMPDMRNFHQMGRTLVPVLRLSSSNKAEKPKVQGETTFENDIAGGQTRTRTETGFAGESNKTKSQNGFEHRGDQF